MITISMTVTAAAARMAMASRGRRRLRNTGLKPEIAAAMISGTTTVRGSS